MRAWLTAIGLTVLVILAVLVSILRLAPPLPEAYRAALSEYLSTQLGYRVRFGSARIGLSGLRPRLRLEGVAFSRPLAEVSAVQSVQTDAPILEAQALELDLDLAALLKGHGPQLTGVRLVGGRLVIAQGADRGSWWPRLEATGGDSSSRQQPGLGQMFAHLLTRGWAEWTGGEVLLVDATARPLLRLTDIRLHLDNAGAHHGLELDARLVAPAPWLSAAEPGVRGVPTVRDLRFFSSLLRRWHPAGAEDAKASQRLHLALRLSGPPTDPLRWQGQGYGRLEVQDLGWIWPAGLLGLDRIATHRAQLSVWLTIGESRLLDALADVQIQGLRPRRARDGSSAQDPIPPGDLAVIVQFRRLDAGWQVLIQGQNLGLPDARIADLEVELRLGLDGSAQTLSGQMAGAELEALRRLLAVAPWGLPPQAMQLLGLHLRGTLDELGVWLAFARDTGQARWQFKARLSGLGIMSPNEQWGVAGLDLWLGGDQDGGWGRLGSQGLKLSLSPIFDRPLHLDRLTGRLDWSRLEQGGWQLTAYQVGLDNADLSGRMRLELAWPKGDPQPEIDLSAHVQGREGAPFRPYLPTGLMHPRLVHWLESSIRPGQVTEGHLRFMGPLNAASLHEGQPRLTLDLAFAGVRLDYWPGWPPLTAATGRLSLRDQALDLHLERAHLLDSELSGRLSLPHVRQVERLPIRLEAEGPFADGRRFLAALPPPGLRLAQTLQGVEFGGQARWALDLDVPLAQGKALTFNGQLNWPAPARLSLPDPSIRLSGFSGTVHFNERGIAPSTLTARLGRADALTDRPVRLALATRSKGLDVEVAADVLDLDALTWGQKGTADLGVFAVERLVVTAEQLRLAGISLDAARIEAMSGKAGWHLRLSAGELSGELDWPAQATGQVSLRIDRLDLKPFFKTRPGNPEVRPLPRDWPPLRVHIDQVVWGAALLGALDLECQPAALGARCPRLLLDAPGLLRIEGQGEWQTGTDGSGHLLLDASSPDPGRLLAALDERSAIAAEHASARLDLAWAGGPWAFDWRRAAGRLELALGPGRLLKIEPGVGRLLGVIDLGSIGRRLALDFSDLHAPGFAFERLDGQIAIEHGQARFADLRIEGPSARILVTGTSNLLTQRLDQRILIEPKLGPGLAVASAIAGGPAIGAAVWLVDRAAGNPLALLGRYEYRLTGSWDDPHWSRLGWEPLGKLKTQFPQQDQTPGRAGRSNHFLDQP
ncbi:hypothetical protein GWK36_00575 [Caldichromatium japonicum]|uniref:YhdP central domain-containing protein n=1 Tax=Caldichromatium japonicum TaxID=2699430 RepID=A0A6G7VA05_9GAMM|nr:AsmA-like C-terminal region-containing protein [Caldichromatium japonicum]QIK36740.1 hypothetical protein GWK36_00575 [Caldichromatium japonicum]